MTVKEAIEQLEKLPSRDQLLVWDETQGSYIEVQQIYAHSVRSYYNTYNERREYDLANNKRQTGAIIS